MNAFTLKCPTMDFTEMHRLQQPNRVISLHDSRVSDLGCEIMTQKRICEGNIVEDVTLEGPDDYLHAS